MADSDTFSLCIYHGGKKCEKNVSDLKGKGKVVAEDNEDDDSGESEYSYGDEEEGNEDRNGETDHYDSLDDKMRSEADDEEYLEARENIRKEKRADEANGAEDGLDSEYILEDVAHSDEISSDYVLSTEIVDDSGCEDSEVEDSVRRMSQKVYYDPKCDHKEMKVVTGMRFENGLQCRDALRTWAILCGYPIHFKRVTKNQLEAKCEPPCVWKCYGSMINKKKTFALKVVVDSHTCSFDIHNKQANYKWLAKQYIDVFRVRDMSISDFLEDCNQRFGVQPSRGRLHRAKAHALELLRGTMKQHYAILRNYVAELVRVDREGRFELLLDEASIFKGLYIGFSALKKGFMVGCRWIIGVDGCHLKTCLGGQLLCAIAADANNQMFPLAWAVVTVENEVNWTWFLQILLDELGIRDGNGVTIMSDQQKGLVNAVKSLAPYAEHRNCARHVYNNWKKEFKGLTLMHIFWRAVRSTYQHEWDLAMEELKDADSAAYENFIARDPTRFCKVFFSTMCVNDSVTNNLSETFNGTIVKARGKHIIHMLEDIRTGLRERQYKKMEKMDKVSDKLCPKIRKKLEEQKQWSRYCVASPGLHGIFEVKHRDDRFTVILGDRTCTCRSWDICGIPCIHGLAAIHYMKHDAADYVSQYFTVDTYKKIYSFSLQALNGQKMWPKAEGYPVQPPLIRPMPGRPKKKRRKDRDEKDSKNHTRLRKFGVAMTCQNCFQVGHNSRGCKNPVVQKPSKEQGKRGRPKKQSSQATFASVSDARVSDAPTTATGRRVLAIERAQASSGIGLFVSEHTGDAYLNGRLISEGQGATVSRRGQRKITIRRGGSNSSSTTTTTTARARNVAPTQESQIK